MKTLLTTSLVLMAAMLIAAPASATVILSDNFNDSTVGNLTGQTADTGQTWATFNLGGWTMDAALYVADSLGVGGTNGAGYSTSSTMFIGNQISLASALTSGPIRLEMDVSQTSGAQTGIQYWLSDTTSGMNASLQWVHRTAYGDSSMICFEGLGQTDSLHDIPLLFGTLHTTLDINLTTKTIEYSWYDLDDPTDPTTKGSVDLGTYTDTFNPNRLHATVCRENNGSSLFTGGYDNIMLTVIPEPSTLVLLATGLLGLLCYAWRKQK